MPSGAPSNFSNSGIKVLQKIEIVFSYKCNRFKMCMELKIALQRTKISAGQSVFTIVRTSD